MGNYVNQWPEEESDDEDEDDYSDISFDEEDISIDELDEAEIAPQG